MEVLVFRRGFRVEYSAGAIPQYESDCIVLRSGKRSGIWNCERNARRRSVEGIGAGYFFGITVIENYLRHSY
jgi:hypothetical protein